MTYRERRERRAERLRGWAAKRRTGAAAVFKVGEHYRGDHAFNTQPGHIPERARLIARESRAHESLLRADGMEGRAASIDRAADRAIYSDDPDATDALEIRIAELEAERDTMKRANKDFKAGKQFAELDYLTENHRAMLLSVAKHQPYYMKNGLRFPPYAITNLSGNINKQKKRLAALRGDRTGQCSRCGMTEQSHERGIACDAFTAKGGGR